jgi:hypothetical protein
MGKIKLGAKSAFKKNLPHSNHEFDPNPDDMHLRLFG